MNKKTIDIFNNMIKEIAKMESDEQFDTMFILTCMFIYRMSANGKKLKNILTLLQEFDYKKNFE